MLRVITIALTFIFSLAALASADPFDISKISDEVSFYANTNDDFHSQGRTLQIVALNSVKIGAWFQVEFSGDFNWDTNPGCKHDYYIEVGLVKRVWKNFSLNYQRIYGTFVTKPINQFGVRFSL